MEQGKDHKEFVLDKTHRLTEAGLRSCLEFQKDPPKDGRIEWLVLANGALVLSSRSSNASAEIPAGEWTKL